MNQQVPLSVLISVVAILLSSLAFLRSHVERQHQEELAWMRGNVESADEHVSECRIQLDALRSRLAVTEIDDREDGSTWVRECTPWRLDSVSADKFQ